MCSAFKSDLKIFCFFFFLFKFSSSIHDLQGVCFLVMPEPVIKHQRKQIDSVNMSTEDYEKIYFNQGRLNGRFRIADSGLGWKPAKTAGTTNSLADKIKPYLLPSEEISTIQWSKGCKGFELRINTKNKGIIQLDGFASDDLPNLKSEFSKRFNASIDSIPHSVRGWNWGKFNIERNEMKFSVNGIPSFEIPYKRINNTNLTSKNEIAVEFKNNDEEYQPAGDELVEMRFYVPDYVIEDEEEYDEGSEDEMDVEKEDADENAEVVDEPEKTPEVEKTAAQLFYEELKENADVGENSGDIIASFEEIFFVTPRGRYDIDIYKDSIRLRGKTYEYKLQTKQIQRIFSVPAGDESNHNIVLSIDPPLRQGQTTYPYLVLQFNANDEIQKTLSISDEDFENQYKDVLMKEYDSLAHVVISHVLKGVANKKVIVPGGYQSTYGLTCLPCAYKANQGYIYPLEKSFLFLNKPPLYIQYSDINLITISRAGESSSSSKSFDLSIVLRNNAGVYNFSNFPKEDQQSLQAHLKSKNLKVKNEDEEQKLLLKKTLNDQDDEVMGSEDDDDSDDADFDLSAAEKDNADSELSEEFDSNAEGADSDVARDSDLDDEIANDEELEDEPESELSDAENEPPKKKTKN